MSIFHQWIKLRYYFACCCNKVKWKIVSGKCIDSKCPTFASCLENVCTCNPGFVNISGECKGENFFYKSIKKVIAYLLNDY